MNRCPCGYFGHPHDNCSCSPLDVQRCLARVSGPLLGRIDLHLEVPAVKYALAEEAGGEPSAAIRERVDRARAVQRERFAARPGIFANAHMAPRDIRAHCRVSDGGLLRIANPSASSPVCSCRICRSDVAATNATFGHPSPFASS